MRHKTTDEHINRSAAAAGAAMAGDLGNEPEPGSGRHGRFESSRDDSLLDHYFKRIDPKVAASFTASQRQALRTMLGMRGKSRHTVEVRRSIAFGRSRYYLVCLLGREQRVLARLHRERLSGSTASAIRYIGLVLLLLLPVVGLIYFG